MFYICLSFIVTTVANNSGSIWKPEQWSYTYGDIAPSWIIAESVCDVVSKTLCQVVHKLSSLETRIIKFVILLL